MAASCCMAAMLRSTPSLRSNAPFTFPSKQARAALSCWRARGCPPGPPMYASGTLEGRFPILGEKSVQHVDRLALRFAYIVLPVPVHYLPLASGAARDGDHRALLRVAAAARDAARHGLHRLLFLRLAARHHPQWAHGRSAPGARSLPSRRADTEGRRPRRAVQGLRKIGIARHGSQAAAALGKLILPIRWAGDRLICALALTGHLSPNTLLEADEGQARHGPAGAAARRGGVARARGTVFAVDLGTGVWGTGHGLARARLVTRHALSPPGLGAGDHLAFDGFGHAKLGRFGTRRGAAERLILFLTDVLVTGDLAAATGFVAGHPLVAAQQGAGHLAATQGRGHTDLERGRIRARRPLRRGIGSTGGRPPGTRFHTGHPGRPIDVAAADLATATGSGGRDLGRRRLRRGTADLADLAGGQVVVARDALAVTGFVAGDLGAAPHFRPGHGETGGRLCERHLARVGDHVGLAKLAKDIRRQVFRAGDDPAAAQFIAGQALAAPHLRARGGLALGGLATTHLPRRILGASGGGTLAARGRAGLTAPVTAAAALAAYFPGELPSVQIRIEMTGPLGRRARAVRLGERGAALFRQHPAAGLGQLPPFRLTDVAPWCRGLHFGGRTRDARGHSTVIGRDTHASDFLRFLATATTAGVLVRLPLDGAGPCGFRTGPVRIRAHGNADLSPGRHRLTTGHRRRASGGGRRRRGPLHLLALLRRCRFGGLRLRLTAGAGRQI